MSAEIMAIINTSPDSFSGDGIITANTDHLRKRIQTALTNGADILDIGGQSTRPGAEIINEETEITRITPAIAIARQLSPTIPISIDTFKPAVAKAAFALGATIINDITGLRDPNMIALGRETKGDVVVMHMRGMPQTMSTLIDYPNGIITELKDYFKQRTDQLIAAGIAKERIIIDLGIGFAKTAPQSFNLTTHLADFHELGFRILYGASNKSFIGKALAHDGIIAPIEDRTIGTAVVQTTALLGGASILRVHDVKSAVQTRTIVEALQGQREMIA